MSNANNLDKLKGILGFDPAANGTSSNAFSDALKEINQERDLEIKGKAKELLKKAMDLRTQQDKARKQFQSNDAKIEKEMGKLLRAIEAMASGKEPTPEKEDGGEDKNS